MNADTGQVRLCVRGSKTIAWRPLRQGDLISKQTGKNSQSPDFKSGKLVAKYSSIQDHVLRLMKTH